MSEHRIGASKKISRTKSYNNVIEITRTKRTSKEHPRNAYGTPPLTVKYMKVLTVKEAADQLKVKPQWVYSMLRGGGLPFIRLGRLIRIDEDSLEEWLAERRSGA